MSSLAPRFGDLSATLARFSLYDRGIVGMSDYFSIAATFSPHPCFPRRVFLPLHEGEKPACLPSCPKDTPPGSPITHDDDAMPGLIDDDPPAGYVYALVNCSDSTDSMDSGEFLFPPPRAVCDSPQARASTARIDEVPESAPPASEGVLVSSPPALSPIATLTDTVSGDNQSYSREGAN